VDEPTVEAAVRAWVTELAERTSLSASAVQDRLLDLWGLLPEGSARREVEQWLTETLERELYTAADVSVRLLGLVELEHVG